MSKTTIDLERSVRDDLKQFKSANGHSSMSAAVADLLARATGGGGDSGSDGGPEAMDDGSDQEENDGRVPQLLSYEILSGNEKALKYFTGLRTGAKDWLMAALRLAVRCSRVFVVFFLSGSAREIAPCLCARLLLTLNPSHRTMRFWHVRQGTGGILIRATANSFKTTASSSS